MRTVPGGDAAGALRRGTLAASVLHDIPLQPRDDGVVVGRTWDDPAAWTPVSWADLAGAVDGVDPESLAGRLRLRDWLGAYTMLAQLAQLAQSAQPAQPPTQLVALALPVGHVLHPGAGWARERILGGVLDVGLGIRTTLDGEGLAVPLAPGAARTAGMTAITLQAWWRAAAARRDAMGVLATERLDRTLPTVLRPLGGCDVLTLLSSRLLRSQLATSDGTGMRAVAVPMRSRGWFDLARIDPAFVGAPASATEPELRGVLRSLLVTADEVVLTPPTPAAQLARDVLLDPAAHQPASERDMLYR